MASVKRGGQPSNTNSIKHGFYSKKLAVSLRKEIAEAALVAGLDQEIAFVRLKLSLLAASTSPAEISLALDCTRALSNLLKTRYTISIDPNESLKNAIDRVLTEIAAPLKLKNLLR